MNGRHLVSLFSGVGGFEYGFEQAGFETVYQCEIDEKCRSVLRRHFPKAEQWSDISTLTGKQIADSISARGVGADVVVWGSPCQDLSVGYVNKMRKGLDGERSGLFYEGMRVIKELRKETNNEYPRISVWENVAGALSSNDGADFGRVLDEMAEAGSLVVEWRVLDARFFGVPQRRRRVFVVAIFDRSAAERCVEPIFPISGMLRRTSSESGRTAQGDSERADRSDELVAESSSGDEPIIVGGLSARDWKGVSSQYVRENKVVIVRPAAEDQPFLVRRLTPIECERLMGWRDDWTLFGDTGKKIADSSRYQMCGNGVASPVAKWVAEQVARIL